MPELASKRRPEFRNIHVILNVQYRLPLAGEMSILHRISGAGMFLTLPLIVWLFDMSLTSELSYAQLTEVSSHWFVKIIYCALAWAFIHHFFGGIRHLVNDAHIGISKEASPTMAKSFMAISLLVSGLAWLFIFGVI